MKNSTSMLAAVVLATASLGASSAYADDISSPDQALTIVDNSAHFGDAFAMNNNGDTFMDQFTFNVTGPATNLDAIISSISRTAATGLDITGLSLYSGAGALISAGTMGSTGIQDIWTLSVNNLTSGNYYLQVSGSMVSDTSGAFGGSMMLNPVPEPETYGMMLAGLSVVGMLARRRQLGKKA